MGRKANEVVGTDELSRIRSGTKFHKEDVRVSLSLA